MKHSLQESEEKIKEEAKQLIAQTKLMMSTLNTNESTALTQRDLQSPQLDSPNCSISRRSNVVSLDKHLINTSLIEAKTDLKLTIKHLCDKVAELAQRNKCLEKEIKEKDNQLSLYAKRLNSKNDEVSKLNQVIINERSDNAVVENLKLKRKIAALEQTIEENKAMYEQIIKEYQDKLSDLTENHSKSVTQLNKMQESNEKIADYNEAMKSQFNDLNEKMSIATIKCEQYEQKSSRNEKLLERTQDSMRVLLMMLKEIAQIENTAYASNKRIISKLKDIADTSMPLQ